MSRTNRLMGNKMLLWDSSSYICSGPKITFAMISGLSDSELSWVMPRLIGKKKAYARKLLAERIAVTTRGTK